MPIALTCDCGARFALDDVLSGQKVPCPECRQPLEVPAVTTAAQPRTSLFALASVVLALFGGFTIVGGVAAAVLGLVALVQIGRRRDRLIGAGLAMAGVTAGLSFTALTVGLLIRRDLIPIDAWVRARTVAVQVDTSGALEVVTSDGNLIVRRPSEQWGRVHSDRSDDPAVGDLQLKRELLLADVARHAFIDVGRMGELTDVSNYADKANEDLNPVRPPLLGEDDNGPDHRPRPQVQIVRADTSPIERIGVWEMRQWGFEVQRGGQTWRFLIRVYKKTLKADPRNVEPAYIVRGYAPRRQFEAVKDDLKAAMNSVELPK